MSKKLRNVLPAAPAEKDNIKIKAPANYAAGPYAVKVALDHAIGEMGAVRAFQTLAKLNQKGGIDCPGCAWPDPDDKRSVLGEYCENGAKALAEEATLKRVTPSFFELYNVEELSTWSDYKLGKSGRLTTPMILREGSIHYEPISWEEAFQLIGSTLQQLKDPNEAIFYTSGRSSNEAAFLYGVFARAYGTNNMPDCSNMCHESSGVALTETVGIGKGSVTLDDIHKAEVVMILGQNPGTNHPRMLSALQKLKANGGKVVTVNPLEEAGLKRFRNPQKLEDFIGSGTQITDLYLQVRLNQDIPLLKAIMKSLIELEKTVPGTIDQDFINGKTEGYQALVRDLESYRIQDLIKQAGISMTQLDECVDILKTKKKIIICWAMGLTQHKNGVANIKECVNLLLLKGAIGKEGAGTCPVRGHSNVQGDRSVGIVHRTSPALKASLMKVFGIDAPEEHGLDTVECIQAMHEGKGKVFIALGGNFVSAASDTHYTAAALQSCDLTVSISTKLNRSHLITGKIGLILPTLGRSERDIHNNKPRAVSVENSMGKVHTSQGSLAPASEMLMSEPAIVAAIGDHTLGSTDRLNWKELGVNYEMIRDKIASTFQGFENYNSRINDDGFYLPNNAREGNFSNMPNGKAIFSINPLPHHELAEDEFLLMSIRSHDQFNTTIYGLDDRYRGIYNARRALLMNRDDMAIYGLKELDLVDLVSNYNEIERRAKTFTVVPYDIPRQNLACYFPEANVLIPIDQYADRSNTPISKSVKVKVIPQKK